jgi:hypothetical protein
MDWEIALPFIASLTQDLTVCPLTSPDHLLEARKAIVQSVLSGQGVTIFGLVMVPNIQTPPSVLDPETLNYLQPQQAQLQLLFAGLRRDFSLSISPDSRLNYSLGAGQNPSSTYGPFFDGYGRIVAVDVFDPIAPTGLQLGMDEFVRCGDEIHKTLTWTRSCTSWYKIIARMDE